MDEVWPLIAMLVGLLGLNAGLVWLMMRARRRGITGALAIADELYQPTAHQAQIETRAQVERGNEDIADGGR